MWALIVCYFPDFDKLSKLINALRDSVDRVVILDNGGVSAKQIFALNSEDKVFIVKMPGNVGLGSAFNHGFQLASEARIEYVLTFDQDSSPTSQYPREILREYLRIKKMDDSAVAVGPTIIDDRDPSIIYSFAKKNAYVRNDYGYLRANSEDAIPVLVMVQSGMIIPVKTWADICKFDDQLFIEFVDTDWCYRINHAGFSIYGTRLVSMRHEISDKAPYKVFGFSLLTYSPIRRYYFFRNVVYLLKQDYVPLSHKFRLITGMLNRLVAIVLLDKYKGKAFFEALRGLWNGIVRFHRKSVRSS